MTSTATMIRPTMTRMTAHEIGLAQRFHILLDHGHDAMSAAVTVWRNADLDLPFSGAFMEHLTGGALTVDSADRLQRGPRWEAPGVPGRVLPVKPLAVAVVVDLAERFGMPAPVGSFAECDCAADIATTGTCCERGRRRAGIPVPPMEFGAVQYVPHNRD